MSRIHVLVVDDTADDRRRLGTKLKKAGFDVTTEPPPPGLDVGRMLEHAPDILVVDYQLTEAEPSREAVHYRGAALAAAVRDQRPSLPIILVTRSPLLSTSAKGAAPARDVFGAYDALIFKEAVYTSTAGVASRLRSLHSGFRALDAVPETKRDWAAVKDLLAATDAELENLRKADPPEELLTERTWRVPELARWLDGVVFRYPGIFYDPLHTASILGLDLKSFRSQPVQRYFSKARGRAPLIPEDGRWWVQRTITLASNMMKRAGMGDEPISAFSDAWLKVRKGRLLPSVCNTSGKSPADCVCYLLDQPVLRSQSLPYHPDNRPAIMDTARVSIKAIQTSHDFDIELFPPDARPVVEALEKTAT